LFERVCEDTVADIFLLSETKDMKLLRKGCMEFISGNIKNIRTSEGVLSSEELAGVKKMAKIYKKELKKKKIPLSPSVSLPSINPTPESFFSQKTVVIFPVIETPVRKTLERSSSLAW